MESLQRSWSSLKMGTGTWTLRMIWASCSLWEGAAWVTKAIMAKGVWGSLQATDYLVPPLWRLGGQH